MNEVSSIGGEFGSLTGINVNQNREKELNDVTGVAGFQDIDLQRNSSVGGVTQDFLCQLTQVF